MKKKILRSLIVVLVLALTCIYALPGLFTPEQSSDVANSNASFNFDEEEVLEQLRQQRFSAINKDLLKKVDENKLSGKVNVIITLSDGSLVGQYNQNNNGETLGEYLGSAQATADASRARSRQVKLEEKLVKEGLIKPAKYHYSTIMDGFSAETTYENISKILNYSGVYRVIISNTYNPAVAVENDVNVYDTGIFKSEGVEYTGKGTIVAILDTGCDYAHPAFTTHTVEEPLYDSSDIERLLPNTVAYDQNNGSLEAREVYYGNLTKGKIAFGYDYADKDSDIMPFLSEHGTHVAGIIGGYADEPIAGKNDDFDGDPETTLRGVAIDTQFAIMKVFSDYQQGAEDVDILAGLEDCVNLNVDAINMSLGSSCGFTREVDEEKKNEIYDNIEKAGISLIVAASNDYSSAYGSEFGNTNKVENPDSGTVGAPATYNSALAVASINGNKDKYIQANGEREIFFLEAANQLGENYNFFERLGVTGDAEYTFDYVTVPGLGAQVNYSSIDVRGKIALVKRGDINFEDKVIYATQAGAVGVIIYNNVYGDILMTVGNNAPIAVISIGKDDGEYLASQPEGKLVMKASNTAGPFMSDFSSWGPNPDLKIKPEITAHGGNIWSSIPGGGYEKLSGTSMACPNMCGIAVLVRQYVKDNFEGLEAPQVRDLVYQLLMSTATIAHDKQDNPYSPRKQGAGIADIVKATTTKAYITTKDKDGKTMSTSKLELGDDAKRAGVYTMTFSLVNISDETLSYKLGNYTMTESLSADKKYVAEMAYMLGSSAEYSVKSGGSINGDVVTVQGKQTAEITVKITLSDADKAYLNESFVNGMYVEGFITLASQNQGVDLNVPFLAFYGDWAQAPIFDKDYYEVETTAHNNAIDDEDKIKADYFATTPYAMYFYDYIIPMGTYLYDMGYGDTPIPASEEHSALSYYINCLNGVYAVYAGLLRGAKELRTEVRNTTTGEVVWSQQDYNCYKAHYNGTAMPYVHELRLSTVDDNNQLLGHNNEHFEVTLTATLDWDGERNVSDTFTFSFYVDYQAPTVTDSRFYTKYNNSTRKTEYYVDLTVYDNHYAMGVRPITVNYAKDGDGKPVYGQDGVTRMLSVEALSDNVTPVYQETRGSTSIVTIEITDYMDNIRNSLQPDCIMFQLDDYALNTGLVSIPLPETDNKELGFDSEKTQNITLDIGETLDLTQFVVSTNEKHEIDEETAKFLFMLDWSSANEGIVAVHNGIAEGRSQGTTTVSFTSGGTKKDITVTVTDQISDDSNGYDQTLFEEIRFTGYTTKFAFNSDIDYSDIGESGDEGYFEDSAYISFYPTERVQLHYIVKPWNLLPKTEENPNGRYTVEWSSSNNRVATVDENGVVKAVAEGTAVINLRITIDGRLSPIRARCDVNVKSEFVIENRQLVAYKGAGGAVKIPDDEGLMYISSFAFSHYTIDNDTDLGDDYDFDDRKTAIGNDTVKSVIVPNGVTTIDKFAFYNCTALKEVVLPDTCTTIDQYAFYGDKVLQSINLDDVERISDYAFCDCNKLQNVGSTNLAHPYVIGAHAFENCTQLARVNLTNLRRAGVYAFAGCSALRNVYFGESTRVSEFMFYRSGIRSTATVPLIVYSDVIPDNAFSGCGNLVTVELVNDVTYVGNNAFSGCTGLTSVTFDGVCEKFGANAFAGCNKLVNFKADKYYLEGGILYDSADKTKILFAVPTQFTATEFTLPVSVTEIGDGAFTNTGITKIIVPSGSQLHKIGDNAFYGTNLNNITFPESVDTIGNGAFARTKLANVDLSSTKVTAIGNNAFAECTSLTTVKLPASCTRVGQSAFDSCSGLTSINLDKVTYVGSYAFYMSGLKTVELTADNVEIGEGAFAGDLEGSGTIANLLNSVQAITLGDGARVGAYAFALSNITELNVMAKDVVIDGEFAFAFCINLETANLNGIVGKLGDFAFVQCVSLEKAQIPNVEEIGESAFRMDVALVEVETKELTKVGGYAFYPYVSGNQEVPVPLAKIDLSKVTEIGDCAFLETALTEVDLSSVVKIGEEAFELTDQLTAVNAPNLEEVGMGAFYGAERLSTFSAPKLKKLDMQVFAETKIKTIEIGDALEAVEGALFGAENFEGFTVGGEKNFQGNKVVLKDGVLYLKQPNGGLLLGVYPVAKTDTSYKVLDGTVRIEFMAFAGNKYLQEVTLPESLVSIGDYAFYECSKLSKVIFRSYYAPTLEGSATGQDEIETKVGYPGFDDLYKYDFYFRFGEPISFGYGNLLAYRNFRDLVTHFNKDVLEMEIPSNSQGYDSPLYKAFFGKATTSDETVGKFAHDFMKAVDALPDTVDRYCTDVIDGLITYYELLQANKDELKWVDESYYTAYEKAVRDYNVDVARNAIVKLTDMDNTVYSYRMLSNALRLYNNLSVEEKAQLDTVMGEGVAKGILDSKSTELKNVLGITGEYDLSKEYIDRVVDQLKDLFGDMKAEDITVDDFAKLKEAYRLINTLTDEEKETGKSKLDPYQKLIDAWNRVANNTNVIETAEAVASAPYNALFATIAGINALIAVAFVVLKGGIL